MEKYSLLKDEIARLWQMKKVVVIPIVVGALGTMTTKFEKYIENLKSVLLGTARIIRKVLSCQVPRKGYCYETFNIWLMSALTAKKRYQNLSSVRDNIEHASGTIYSRAANQNPWASNDTNALKMNIIVIL